MVLVLAGAMTPASQAPPAPFAFFEPTVVVSTADQARLDRGETLVRILPGTDGQIAVFAASRLDATPERVLERLRGIELLKQGRLAPIVRRFSDPPLPGDLSEQVLSDGELEDLRRCRPGNCGVKLSGAEIQALVTAAKTAGPSWREQLQAGYREAIHARVVAFIERGFAGLPDYDDRGRAVRMADAHALIRRATPFLRDVDTKDAESFLYWAKESAAGKATMTVSQVQLIASDRPGWPAVLAISSQVYASHYMDGAIGVTAVVRSADGQSHYLVYVNRTSLDVLGGFLGPLKRAVIEGRIEKETTGVFSELRRRIEREQ